MLFTPVTANVPPSPIMANAADDPEVRERAGERTNQVRAAPAVSTQVLSMTRANTTKNTIDLGGRMVQSAVVLLAKKGVQATSSSEVLEASGEPRGSLYRQFPGGKDELIAAAVDLAGDGAIALLDRLEGWPTAEILDEFLAM